MSDRPAGPTTPEQLERSIQVIRLAIAAGIVLIVAMTIVFLTALGAPTLPLLPIAAFVVVIDIVMLVSFTRRRRRAIERIREREGGVPSG